MKKLISSIIFLAAAFSLCAQDARQRTVETVVADALAAMPANTATDFNARIADLAAAAPASVVETAKLMKPAAEGVANNLYEYALSGLADYASADSKCADAVREGFAQAVKETSSTEVKAFLLSQFRKIATTADAAIFNEYVYDPALASIAIGALVDIPGTEDTILDWSRKAKPTEGFSPPPRLEKACPPPSRTSRSGWFRRLWTPIFTTTPFSRLSRQSVRNPRWRFLKRTLRPSMRLWL